MFWYCACILFCSYCISLLLEERFELTYRPIKQTEDFNYLDCIELANVKNYSLSNNVVDLDQLNDDVFDFFVELKAKQEKLTRGKDELRVSMDRIEYEELFNRTFLQPIRTRSYLIHLGQFCFIREREKSLFAGDFNWPFFFPRLFSIFKHYAFKEDTYEFTKLDNPPTAVQRFVVVIDHPYSGCALNYSKFRCLHSCFKERRRLSKYYYRGDENGSIWTTYDAEEADEQHEVACFKRCPKNSCKFVYFRFSYNNVLSNLTVVRAEPALPKADFYLQLFGLISFFVNITICQFSLLFVKLALVNCRIRGPLRHPIGVLRKLILLAVFGCCLLLFAGRLTRYADQLNHPPRGEMKSNRLEPETMHLVVCIKLHKIRDSNYDLSLLFEPPPENKTFAELENSTGHVFGQCVKRIYLEFMDKQVPVNSMMLQRKVLFKNLPDNLENLMMRCFQVAVYPKEPKYQSLLSISKLVVEMNKCDHAIYLLPEGERFHSKSFRFVRKSNFAKRIIKRVQRAGRCVNYQTAYPNCNSKANCFDRCFHREFSKTFGGISIQLDETVIDKDFFTEDEWSRYRANEDRDVYLSFVEGCRTNYTSCEEVLFENTEAVRNKEYVERTNRIDLYYDISRVIEEEPSLRKLLFDLVGIQSILFGMNVWKLSIALCCLIRIRFEHQKFYFAAVRLACWVGALYHVYCILDNLVNAPLIYSQSWVALDHIDFPEVMFCFSFDKSKIDPTRKLTGDYLNELTEELNVETLFQRIAYLNESRQWSDLDLNSNRGQFRVEITFFMERKCFKLIYPVRLNRSFFRFLDNTEVLKVFFHWNAFEKKMPVYFFTAVRNTLQFSKISELHLNTCGSLMTFFVRQVFFEIRVEDKFNLVKNPLSLLEENSPNDADRFGV